MNSAEAAGLTSSAAEMKGVVGVVEAAGVAALAGDCCTENTERRDST